MKTSVIDNSLVNMNFRQGLSVEVFEGYVSALGDMGIRYLETDFRMLPLLALVSCPDRIIYRITTEENIDAVNRLLFAYAVLPLNMYKLAEKISVPVILEISLGDVDPIVVMSLIDTYINLGDFAMIRFCGNFGYDGQKVTKFVKQFRTRYAVPLEICADNMKATALSDTLYAARAKADAVSVCFGNDSDYASADEFFVTGTTEFHAKIPEKFFAGYFRATMYYALLSCEISKNILVRAKSKFLAGRDVSAAGYLSDRLISEANMFARSDADKFEDEETESLRLNPLIDKETADELYSVIMRAKYSISNVVPEKKRILN